MSAVCMITYRIMHAKGEGKHRLTTNRKTAQEYYCKGHTIGVRLMWYGSRGWREYAAGSKWEYYKSREVKNDTP